MQVSWVAQSFQVPRERTPRRRRRLAIAGPWSGVDVRRLAMVVLLAAALVAALAPSLPWSAATDAPAEPTAQVWPSGLREAAAAALAADAYAVQAISAGSGGATWLAPNPAQGLDTRFSGEGLTVAPSSGTEANWSWGLSLAAWGRGDQLVPALGAQPVAEANRVEYSRGELTEWYVNGAEGLEQGFTLDSAVAGQGSGPLVVQLQTSGGLQAELIDQGQAIAVRSSEGANLLRYDKLVAYDATGAEIPAHLGLDGAVLTLSVDDAGAVYPLVIDPLIASQQAKLTASDGAEFEQLGYSVAVSGDTAVVGAPFDDDAGEASGSAYVFTRSGTDWTQQDKLTADDAAAGDWFGWSVAASGDTAVVGARLDDDAGEFSGSAYVFTRSGTDWTQQDKLTADDAAEGDEFGYSVAVSGDTAVVGAPFDDDAGSNSGSAYVFTRSGSTWTQQDKLTADDAVSGAQFGFSVAISGETAVVAAPFDDDAGANSGSAYVFTRSGGDWIQQDKLTADDAAGGDAFGYSVAVSGDTAVVGAYLDDDAGANSGSAYVFTRSGGDWTQQHKLTADDAAAGDWFGSSVAVSGDTAVVGARRAGEGSGSAYVFTRSGTDWTQQDKLTADDAASGDHFGFSVAVSGDTAVVSAPLDNDAGIDSGSAYVFELTPVSVTIDDVTVTEGDSGTTEATFTLTRNFGVGIATVEARTLDFSASAADDYQSVSTTVSFADGETTKTVTVAVNGDAQVEPDEFFLLVLFDPVGVEIAEGEGRATIVNDDDGTEPPPTTTSTMMATTTTTMATTTTTTAPSGTVVTIDDTVVSNAGRGRVTGTVSCEAGRAFSLELTLTQGDGSGQGNTQGTCSGSPQAFAIGFVASAGTFSDGSAQACVSGATAEAGSRSFTSIGEACEEVTIDVV